MHGRPISSGAFTPVSALNPLDSMMTLKPKPRSNGPITEKGPAKKAVDGARWNSAVSAPDEQFQLKKQAVIAEAARAFGRHGANNVSLDEIAASLNVTKPALYYYFKNKQELIYECHELVMRTGDKALADAIASESTGYVRVTTFIRNYLALLTNEFGAPAILHDLSSMTPSDQKKIVARRRKFNHQLRQTLEDGIQDGSIAPCDPKLAVFWVMGAVSSIPQWYHTDGALDGAQIAEAFIGFLDNGIRPVVKR